MEQVHTHGILMAELLQQKTMGLRDMWLSSTHLGDPNAAFFIIFPFTYYISKRAGVAVLWIAALSEWLNLVLKWMLFGERPFWWIGESGVFSLRKPDVQQFPSTCETGPGSPSGHAMVTAAVWWVVVTSLGSHLYDSTRSAVISWIPYVFYVLILLVVGISRVFILAHFPHQVVVGSITGCLLGIFLSQRVPHDAPLQFFVCCSVGLLLSALLLNGTMQLLGIDLTWSITLAKKWCSNPDWIRMDSFPFSSLTRDCGSILGLGLALYWKPGGWELGWAPKALWVALTSIVLFQVSRLPLPVQPQGLFYCHNFFKYMLVPQIVMTLVPGLVHVLTQKRRRD